MKVTSSYKKQLFLLGAFLAPVTAAALFLWSLQLTEQLNSLRISHKSQHESVGGFIHRDVDDLQSQIQSSLRGQTFLPGDFRFSTTPTGLEATHTSLPAQPLKITLEGEMAFAKPLNASKNLEFAIVTHKNEILSYSQQSKKAAHNITGDATLLGATLDQPVAFFGFDQSKIAPLTGRRLLDRPRYALFKSKIKGSNLTLYSIQNVNGFWNKALQSLALILMAALSAFLLGALALWHQRTRQARTREWVSNFMESLRFGKIENELETTNGVENEVILQIKDSLKHGSALRKFMESEWVDHARSTVSWTFFKRLITHWSEGLSTNESDAPSRWYISALRIKKAQHFEHFAAAFTKTFGEGAVFIFQAKENECYIASRDDSVATFTHKIRSTLRNVAQTHELASHDFALESMHVSGTKAGQALNILQSASQNCARLYDALQETLDERCVNIRNENSGASLIQMSLSEILNSPFYTLSPSNTENPRPKFPKRQAVKKSHTTQQTFELEEITNESGSDPNVASPKKRPQLPPPPTLKTKNLNKAGRGFVRITDALGKSDWIEISAQSGQNSTLITSPRKPKDLQ